MQLENLLRVGVGGGWNCFRLWGGEAPGQALRDTPSAVSGFGPQGRRGHQVYREGESKGRPSARHQAGAGISASGKGSSGATSAAPERHRGTYKAWHQKALASLPPSTSLGGPGPLAAGVVVSASSAPDLGHPWLVASASMADRIRPALMHLPWQSPVLHSEA